MAVPGPGVVAERIAILSDAVRCISALSKRKGEGPPRAAANPRNVGGGTCGLLAFNFIALISFSRNSVLERNEWCGILSEAARAGGEKAAIGGVDACVRDI